MSSQLDIAVCPGDYIGDSDIVVKIFSPFNLSFDQIHANLLNEVRYLSVGTLSVHF